MRFLDMGARVSSARPIRLWRALGMNTAARGGVIEKCGVVFHLDEDSIAPRPGRAPQSDAPASLAVSCLPYTRLWVLPRDPSSR